MEKLTLFSPRIISLKQILYQSNKYSKNMQKILATSGRMLKSWNSINKDSETLLIKILKCKYEIKAGNNAKKFETGP